MNEKLSAGVSNIQSMKGQSTDVLYGGLNEQDASKAIAASYVQLVKVCFLLVNN